MSKHLDKIVQIKHTFVNGTVSTIDDELYAFWSDRKLERFPNSPDNAPRLLLLQTHKSANMVEYKINYNAYSSSVEDLSLLRSIIRIKESSNGNPELSWKIWRKRVHKVTPEDDYTIWELDNLEDITTRELSDFYGHLIDAGYQLAQEVESHTNKVKDTNDVVEDQHEKSKPYNPQRRSIRKMLKLIACREYYRKKQRGDIFSWTYNPFGNSGRLRVETADKIAQKFGMEIKDKWEEKEYDSEDYAQNLLKVYPDLEDDWEEYKKQDY